MALIIDTYKYSHNPRTDIFELMDEYAKTKSSKQTKEYKMSKPTTGRFLVGSYTDARGVSFSTKPHEHWSENDAKAEAARLAKINPSVVYVVVEVKGAVVANAVTWS